MPTVYKYGKPTPSMSWFMRFLDDAKEYNQLSQSLYCLFDSNTLTRNDYLRIVGILYDKLPIYEATGSAEQYKKTVLTYVEFNYPPNPDIKKVIYAFASCINGMRMHLVCCVLLTLKNKLADCANFVGSQINASGKTAGKTPVDEKTFTLLKKVNYA